jgi:aryl-alcohol dehydrogenase-like predicted oxidoreductase
MAPCALLVIQQLSSARKSAEGAPDYCRGIERAVAAAVPLAFVRIPFGFHNRSAMEAVIAVCAKYSIPVIGDECTWFGLMDKYFVDMPAPNSLELSLPVTSIPHALACANQMGGWDAVQRALKVVKTVAQKHNVEMQAVALRWCIDQGVIPVVPVGWRHTAEAFGKRGAPPCAVPDIPLFQRMSFLTPEDMQSLSAVTA